MYPYDDDEEDPMAFANQALGFEDAPVQKSALDPFLSNGYAQQHNLLSSTQKIHEQKATDLLHQALAKQTEVSPSQGYAAALLAAIPTLGGALMGMGQSTPHMPAGVWAKSADEWQRMAGGVGPYAGLAQGARIGSDSVTDFMKSSMEQQKRADDINMKLATLEENKAARLQGEDSQIIQAGLAKEEAKGLENTRFEHEKELIGIRDANNPNKQPVPDDKKLAVANQLIALLGKNPDPEKVKQIQDSILNAKNAEELNKNQEYTRRLILTEKQLSGDKSVPVPVAGMEAAAIADSMPVAVEATMKIYDKAIKDVKPGVFGAFERKGFAALPANLQNQLMANLEMIAMSSAKAAGAGQLSDQERKTAAQKYVAALEMGNLPEAIANDIEVARTKARSYYNQAISSGNTAAQRGLDQLESGWAADKRFGKPATSSSSVTSEIPQRGNYSNPKDYLAALQAYNASH